MKILSLLFLTIFLGKGCDSAKAQEISNAVIEYEANTRGFYQKITVKNQMVTVSKDRSGNDKPVPTKIADADWKELVECFKTVELDSLARLKAPTEKRFYDGAAIANLKITYKDKAYETTSFDHGFPPKQIKKFVNKITSFAKKE
ncbi:MULTISPECIES: hypothetical protein [Flavobacterium]|uniref:Uncharacterized protein n=1 Tax=Flavobacterium gawalongense TaxID=2594432 RepID=A0A553BTK1_9FLAO|nr:hypothetical protein [Flavobacterium gawalongense]TRX02162.1 hypothetical protein FNW33_06725 [Flavobacterium gawalongense]TRX07391.1 hypothetical protein FNW12_06030 [Flavobacterium gawalongense]TRX11559.1 hypothetical protein FNW11_05055 [Flavobacterium gawalongense]TRX12438.1 hypothetical protein FNW10_04835 [Flavobacterium gawalongense]TRX30296.1 hypothetical protein FNW38_04320 [Flavobacterium gawalongense]